MAIGAVMGSGTDEYKKSTLPPNIISLGVSGKFLTASNEIEVNVAFANVVLDYRGYLKDFVLTYKKETMPSTPFDGKSVVIPKTDTGNVTFKFNIPADYLGKVGFRVFPRNPDGMYQTVEFVGINAVFTSFSKTKRPTYTGSHRIFQDDKYEWMECYEDGELNVDGTYDVSLVGPGGDTGFQYSESGGAGSGEVKTDLKIPIEGRYTVKIGVGTTPTTISGPNYNRTANAGESTGSNKKGGNGGSGGGGAGDIGGNGGSNGSDGIEGIGGLTGAGGLGQGTPTQLFGDEKTVAGGGGGPGRNKAGLGGVGGGGNGGDEQNIKGVDGTPNTGGGAGGCIPPSYAKGGSGLFAIRWLKGAS